MANSILELIGNTPLLKVSKYDTGCCELYLKLECQNPGGSIKDRIGISMIEAAEKAGAIGPGTTLVEATSGNTGLGLALAANQKGYKLILIIPDKMSSEKINHCRALGAQVVITRSDVPKGHPQYYQEVAERITAETPNSYFINQFANEANALAHIKTTGPEIWEQTNHKVGAVVCGVGSGGTITGLSKYFEKQAPEVDIVLADPEGSILVDYIQKGEFGEAGSWLVEGMGEDFIPPLCDLSRVKHAYTISDKESFLTARDLLGKEGVFGGSSTGCIMAAALKYCKEQTEPKVVVAIVCDTGAKYLSKVYNEFWLADQGFLQSQLYGDLRDLITRKQADGAVVTIAPNETLMIAFNRMKIHGISQLPVVDKNKITGLVDESDLLFSIHKKTANFKDEVSKIMATNLKTLSPSASIDDVLNIIESGLIPIIADQNEFYGMITQIDLLNYLRNQV